MIEKVTFSTHAKKPSHSVQSQLSKERITIGSYEETLIESFSAIENWSVEVLRIGIS